MKILLIVGNGRSGSTILGNVLGSIGGVAHVGELHHIWIRGLATTGYAGVVLRYDAAQCGALSLSEASVILLVEDAMKSTSSRAFSMPSFGLALGRVRWLALVNTAACCLGCTSQFEASCRFEYSWTLPNIHAMLGSSSIILETACTCCTSCGIRELSPSPGGAGWSAPIRPTRLSCIATRLRRPFVLG